MAFWHFNQNNSGGRFDFENGKISHHVIIEADSATAANVKAEEIGLYFYGCDSGRDCHCCGDRWYKARGDGSKTATIYGDDVSGGTYVSDWGWMKEKPEGFIHYADGRVVPVQQVKGHAGVDAKNS